MNLGRLDNDIWMHKFKSGDESALKDLFEIFGNHLFSIASNMTNNRQQSGDIVSESFVKLWRQRTTFTELRNIKEYLELITRNASISYLKHSKHKTSSREALTYFENEKYDSAFSHIMYKDFSNIIFEEIEQLPELSRKIFKMTFIEGLRPEEIAMQLETPTQNVRNNNNRALELLRASLAKKNLYVSMVLLQVICAQLLITK